MEEESNTDSKRKLASIQCVTEIAEHPNAHSLVIATVLGWKVITRVGEVAVGQRVVYLEIDSLVKEDADWLPTGKFCSCELKTKN